MIAPHRPWGSGSGGASTPQSFSLDEIGEEPYDSQMHEARGSTPISLKY